MEKVYGFVWHVVHAEQVASEGAAGAYCKAFETEAEDDLAAATIIHTIVQKNVAACEVPGCEHTRIVTGELSPKMIMGGMTAGMRKIQTPTDKRELVLRVVSALGSLTPHQLDGAFSDFPPVVKTFLNDPNCLTEPTQEEIEEFDLGENFLSQRYPRIKERLVK